MRTDFAAKTELQVGCETYFHHEKNHSSVLLPVRLEFIALLVGEKHPCVFLAATDDGALLL